jgi:hypothetical protein
MKRGFVVVLLAVSVAVPSSLSAQIRGTGYGIEISAGLQGSLSFFQVGFLLPKINDRVFINVKARALSSLTWATFINKDTAEAVSFHPVVVGGVVSIGGVSPFVDDSVRMYGGTDLFLGYSFTPYDSYFYGTGNLIPSNLTFAVVGYFGFEYFTGERSSFFINAGGGFKSIIVDADQKQNLYAVASSWLGSGFGISMGSNIYF